MKKWRATTSGTLVEKEIIKETEKQVVYLENNREVREHKTSDWVIWGDTKEEVKEKIIESLTREANNVSARLESLINRIEKIKSL